MPAPDTILRAFPSLLDLTQKRTLKQNSVFNCGLLQRRDTLFAELLPVIASFHHKLIIHKRRSKHAAELATNVGFDLSRLSSTWPRAIAVAVRQMLQSHPAHFPDEYCVIEQEEEVLPPSTPTQGSHSNHPAAAASSAAAAAGASAAAAAPAPPRSKGAQRRVAHPRDSPASKRSKRNQPVSTSGRYVAPCPET